MKKLLILSALFFGLSVGATAYAQDGDAGSGCDTSPENPTVILALIGGAGAAGAIVRGRLKNFFSKKG